MPAMPGFAGELSSDEIATLANYTRSTFGGRADSDLTAADVERAIAPDDEMPTPLRIVQLGSWAGLAGLFLVVSLIVWLLARRRRHKRQEV
jgi:fructose 5-dehydrogenase cytochrome subunit